MTAYFRAPVQNPKNSHFCRQSKLFAGGTLQAPAVAFTPLKPNSFPQACLDGWMDGNPFYWFSISEIPKKATV